MPKRASQRLPPNVSWRVFRLWSWMTVQRMGHPLWRGVCRSRSCGTNATWARAGRCAPVFAWALEQGFQAVITLDADGQHDVSAAQRLYDAARDGGVDLLIASRHGQFEKMTGLRAFWNRFGVWCMRKRTGFEITDSQSGFRYYSSALLRSVTLNADGYDLEMEVLMKAWRKGFKVASLPVAARVADGRSTSHFRPVRDTWNICKIFLRNM